MKIKTFQLGENNKAYVNIVIDKKSGNVLSDMFGTDRLVSFIPVVSDEIKNKIEKISEFKGSIKKDLMIRLVKKLQEDHRDDFQTISSMTRYKNIELQKFLKQNGINQEEEKTTTTKQTIVSQPTEISSNVKLLNNDQKLEIVKKITNFFSEFDFVPQARFINTMANLQTASECKSYVLNYFTLNNNGNINNIKEKCKSMEFQEIAASIVNTTSRKINNRLIVYFGEPGSGKTTKAVSKYKDAEVVVCHSGITPDELFRGFDFNNGKPTFVPCPLKEAMIKGKPVILDEINLLTLDCLRTLQIITDNKDSVVINGETINIAPGFMIIGTMNLVVNDITFPLPSPLVDRAMEIEEMSLTNQKLVDFAF